MLFSFISVGRSTSETTGSRLDCAAGTTCQAWGYNKIIALMQDAQSAEFILTSWCDDVRDPTEWIRFGVVRRIMIEMRTSYIEEENADRQCSLPWYARGVTMLD